MIQSGGFAGVRFGVQYFYLMKFYPAFLNKWVLPGVVCAVLASGCNLTEGLKLEAVNATSVVQTAGSIIENIKTQSPLLSIAATPTPNIVTPTPQDPSATAIQTTAAALKPLRCDMAGAGNPLDITIPDDSRLVPGERFSKIWRLDNLGSCEWGAGYAVVWFSGEDLSAAREQLFLTTVAPGTSVDFSVDMIAPEKPGLYSGFWMLRNPAGDLFGIGPNGNSPFWVRIQVVAIETAVPTSTATLLATPIVLSNGQASLTLNQSFDLDAGQTAANDHQDFRLDQISPDNVQWMPLNNARFAVFGMTPPGELECQYATLSDQPLIVNNLEADVHLCYRTSDGLPGMLRISSLLTGGSTLEFSYTTWAVP